MVFKNYSKANRKIREYFKTIVLHLRTVNSNKERKKKNYSFAMSFYDYTFGLCIPPQGYEEILAPVFRNDMSNVLYCMYSQEHFS